MREDPKIAQLNRIVSILKFMWLEIASPEKKKMHLWLDNYII